MAKKSSKSKKQKTKVLSPKKKTKTPAKKKKEVKKSIKKKASPKPIKKISPVKKIKEPKKKPVKKGNKPPVPNIVVDSEFTPHKTHLRAGNTAPYFEGKDQSGNLINLYSLSGKTVILFFYPQDDTEGCTKEACSLRDEYNYLIENGYTIIGVSADDMASHTSFAKKYHLPFPLIADTDKTMIKMYDVWGKKKVEGKIFDGIVRTTFVIDGYGIIQHVITEVDTANHAKQILAL